MSRNNLDEHIHKGSEVDRSDFVTHFFHKLGGIQYVIQRGIGEIDTPLVSDLDVVIRRADVTQFVELARNEGVLLHMVTAFGGSRLFVGPNAQKVKRIDLMWRCHYHGIRLLDPKPLLDSRIQDSSSGLYVLPEAIHAQVLFAVKNAYGGAEKYRALLKRHGYPIFEGGTRFRWLLGRFVSDPIRSSVGAMCVALTYVVRFAHKPSGLSVFGASVEAIRQSRFVNYIFQSRVIDCSGLRIPYYSRLGSALCVVKSRRCAELDLSSCNSLSDCESAVLGALRARC